MNFTTFLSWISPGKLIKKMNITLKDISMRCEPYQQFSQLSVRFEATIPTEENLVFGDELSVDIMFLEWKAIVYVVDTGIWFSAGSFLMHVE